MSNIFSFICKIGKSLDAQQSRSLNMTMSDNLLWQPEHTVMRRQAKSHRLLIRSQALPHARRSHQRANVSSPMAFKKNATRQSAEEHAATHHHSTMFLRHTGHAQYALDCPNRVTSSHPALLRPTACAPLPLVHKGHPPTCTETSSCRCEAVPSEPL